jgi:8-oxo-dGTP diphosphatase
MTVICCGAILYKDGQILLGLRSRRRKSFPNVWDLPGGRQEQGESLEQTLVRELQEELGITRITMQYLCRLDIPSQSDDLECHIFLVNEWNGVPSNLAPSEHELIQWFTVEEACLLKLACVDYPAIFRRT